MKNKKTLQNGLTFIFLYDIISKRDFGKLRIHGGLAQLARASGSYPAGRWFKSDIRYHSRPVGQAVKTRPFHGCNMGSIPVRVTKNHLIRTRIGWFFLLVTCTRNRTHSKQTDIKSVCFSLYVDLLKKMWYNCYTKAVMLPRAEDKLWTTT